MKKVKLIPTLLTQSLAEFKEKLKQIENIFSLVQIDCMDNKFVNNKTFYNLNQIRKIRTKAEYELHLMVIDPVKMIKKWGGFKKVKKIVFHYEAVKRIEILEIIKLIRSKKIKPGLAINPETNVKKFEQYIPQLDTVFLMGVQPGWGGQKLKPSVLHKAKYLRKKYPKLNIEIDGGVTIKNIPEIIKSGVNLISAGTLIFSAQDLKKNCQEIKQLIKIHK